MYLLRVLLEQFLAIHNTSLSIQLLKTLNEYLALVVELNSKAEEKKLQEENLFNSILDKTKSTWQEVKKLTWTQTYLMIEIIPTLQKFFSLSEYNEYFLEELLVILKQSNNQLKSIAALSLCDLLSYNYRSPIKKSYCLKISALGSSGCCYERISFILFFKASLKYFSLEFICEYGLFVAFIKLGSDKVLNIRIRFLKAAKEVIVHLTKDLQCTLIKQLKELREDKSRDVKQLADNIYEDIQEILNSNNKVQEVLREENNAKLQHERELLCLVFNNIM
jgi:hypothetical protein